jgi:3',5'-cyclic AMP phosphodiesterase CpdA
MPDILHISDLHFGPNFLPDRAEAVLRIVNTRRPELVVVSGDLTRRAKPDQFRQARAFLDRLDVPVAVTPGNHDVPLYRVFERFLAPHRNYQEFISDELNTVHRLPGLTVVCVDSTRRFTFTNGRIRRWQLEFAARAFAESAADELKVVVTHHHLAPPPDFEGGNVMPGARRAIEAFTDMGVHLILAGHMHRSYIGDSLDFFPGRDRERGIVIVQCGTTTSARGRGRERLKNSLNYIGVSESEIRISHYLWRSSKDAFWPHSEHRFGSRANVWLPPPPFVEPSASDADEDRGAEPESDEERSGEEP